MQTLQIPKEALKETNRFNRNVEWLKTQTIKVNEGAWGSYEDAAKILDRSKAWFKVRRLGHINKFNVLVAPDLVKGKDWRMCGNRVEFRLDSVRALKEKISN